MVRSGDPRAAAVGAPLSGEDVLLTGSGHGRTHSSSVSRARRGSLRARRRPTPCPRVQSGAAIFRPSGGTCGLPRSTNMAKAVGRSFDTRLKTSPRPSNRLPGVHPTRGGRMRRSTLAARAIASRCAVRPGGAGGAGGRAAGSGIGPGRRHRPEEVDRREARPERRREHHLGDRGGLARHVHAGRLRVPGDRLLARQERRHGGREDPDELLDRRDRLVGRRLHVRLQRTGRRRHRARGRRLLHPPGAVPLGGGRRDAPTTRPSR